MAYLGYDLNEIETISSEGLQPGYANFNLALGLAMVILGSCLNQ